MVCRVYHQARKSRDEGGSGEVTNPGEWPWAVLIFSGNKYVGSGVLLDNDVVVTTATKVKEYENIPDALTVRLGDFNPNRQGPNEQEDFPHVETEVDCVKVHPQSSFPDSLEYNVAVLKLRIDSSPLTATERQVPNAPISVVDIRSAPRRPANVPQGVEGSRRNKDKDAQYISVRQAGGEFFEVRSGLLSDINEEFDPLGEPVSGEPVDSFLARSYINTACMPQSQSSFPAGSQCWVAAWGKGLQEQREVSHS